ncbi:MAG: glycosyltransferase family 39 protein [bacterium]
MNLEVGSLKPLLFLALIVIAVLLRAGNLGGFHPMDADEKSWLMVGVSLLNERVPSSWSLFSHLGVAREAGCGQVMTPFLAHPPLFGLLIGGWARLTGQDDWCNFNWALIRVPMIIISVLTISVTYLLVKKLFGGRLALFTILAFVFFPSHIVTSRIVAAEHLVGLLLILGLYLFVLFETIETEYKRKMAGAGMVFLCVVSLLIKLSAIVIPATLVFLALYKRRWSLGVVLLGAALGSVLLLAGYGYYYSWDIFYNSMIAHHDRPQNFWNFWSLFTSLNIGNYGFYDPSIIVGLIGSLALAARKRSRKGIYIFAPLFIFSFLFLYVAPFEAYGWYKYAVYPLIAVGLGYVFCQLFKQRKVYMFLFLPLLSIMLQNSGVLDSQTDKRIMVLMFYGIVTIALLLRNRLLVLKPAFLALLLFMFALEVLWVSRTLGL